MALAVEKGKLRVIPLGGLGEIGLNCLVLEYNGFAIAIDCGLMFPDAHMLGVDLVIPDIEYLRSFGDRFLGFVITHGHEDHQGALPYVLPELRCPVWATPMAAGLLTEKFREHGLEDTPLHVIRPRQTWEVGPFHIEPVHTTHSIVDTVALAIRTPIGTVIHSGDFKIDRTPADGVPPDLGRLEAYGSEGVLLLLSDSTNAERPGRTESERSIRGDLDQIFASTSGKVFFSSFSSHVHRLSQAIELSRRYDRRLVVVGRSLLNSVRIATQLGYLEYPPSLFAEPSEVRSLDPGRVTVLSTGSQGEAMSALIRIAEGGHPHVSMAPGDAVVLSSRVIPGNEKAISNLINHMMRRGPEVFHAQNSHVHVSGHASRDELREMLEIVRPRFFVPVHGEYRHLRAHRALAVETGVAEENACLIENGQVLEIDATGAHRAEPVPAGRVFVDGRGIGDVAEVVLRDRRHLSSDGLVLVILALRQQTGEVIAGPDFVSRGFIPEEASGEYLNHAREIVLSALDRVTPESRGDLPVVKEEVRRALKRYFSRTLERRPVIVPFVMEM